MHPHMKTPSPQLILNLLFTCTLIPTQTRAPPVLQVVYGRPEPSHGTQLQLPAQLNDSVLPQVTELPLSFIFAAFKPSQRSSVYHGIGNVSEMFPAELISLPSPLTLSSFVFWGYSCSFTRTNKVQLWERILASSGLASLDEHTAALAASGVGGPMHLQVRQQESCVWM